MLYIWSEIFSPEFLDLIIQLDFFFGSTMQTVHLHFLRLEEGERLPGGRCDAQEF